MEGLIDILNNVLDWLYYGLVSPLFRGLGQGLEYIVLKPLAYIHMPIAAQVIVCAVLTAVLSFFIRRKLKVEERCRAFSDEFLAKRRQQENIRLLRDWKSRDAMYRSTDRDLDEDFNIHLAQRYSQFVMIYLLPIFLVLAWLNSILSGEALTEMHGSPYLVPLPENSSGVEGLSVTFIFLVGYFVSLVIGFQAKKKLQVREQGAELHQ